MDVLQNYEFNTDPEMNHREKTLLTRLLGGFAVIGRLFKYSALNND